MQIQWFGQSYFKIQVKNNGQEVTMAIDPFSPECGLKPPSFQAEIALITHDHFDHNNLSAIRGEPFVVSGPGEYEKDGVFIYGIPSWHDSQDGKERGLNTIYKISAEDISIAHLGDLGHELNDEQLERLGNVDILLIPVGGIVTIDGKKAAAVVSAVEPRLVIPMHYQIPGLKIKLAGLDEFIKASGLTMEKTDKLKISKKDLPQEETKLVVLNI